jgi:hypothetical protein
MSEARRYLHLDFDDEHIILDVPAVLPTKRLRWVDYNCEVSGYPVNMTYDTTGTPLQAFPITNEPEE